MAFYFARIWLTDSAAKLVLIAAVSVAKISAANTITKEEAEAYLAELSECELKDGELRYVAGGRYDQMNDSNKGCWPAICVSNDH